jgi:MoaA/NifB/PqqE/SkfB family radical SAM enzyme
MVNPGNTAVWIVTRNCNLKCPYCTQTDNSKVDTRIYTEWVVAWNRICPGLLNISGGEPFLFPGFVDMLKDLHSSIKLGITTNLTLPIDEFARCIDPKRVLNITCSRHPSMYKQPAEMFDGKVMLLRSKGFRVTVNLVAHPDQMYLIPAMKKHYEAMGVNFHVDPYRDGEERAGRFNYDRKEKLFLQRYVQSDREDLLKDVKYNKAFCSAGQDYIFVEPNGDYWPCMLHRTRQTPPRGNVFVDANVFRNGTVCGEYHFCLGCDRDWTTVEIV